MVFKRLRPSTIGPKSDLSQISSKFRNSIMFICPVQLQHFFCCSCKDFNGHEKDILRLFSFRFMTLGASVLTFFHRLPRFSVFPAFSPQRSPEIKPNGVGSVAATRRSGRWSGWGQDFFVEPLCARGHCRVETGKRQTQTVDSELEGHYCLKYHCTPQRKHTEVGATPRNNPRTDKGCKETECSPWAERTTCKKTRSNKK